MPSGNTNCDSFDAVELHGGEQATNGAGKALFDFKQGGMGFTVCYRFVGASYQHFPAFSLAAVFA